MRVRVAESWRLGIVISDDTVILFAPSPGAVEPPTSEDCDANGLIVRGPAAELLAHSISGPHIRPILVPHGISSAEGQEAVTSPDPIPGS